MNVSPSKRGKASQDSAQFRIDVRDETGRRVVTSTILMVMECIEGRNAHDDGTADQSEALR